MLDRGNEEGNSEGIPETDQLPRCKSPYIGKYIYLEQTKQMVMVKADGNNEEYRL